MMVEMRDLLVVARMCKILGKSMSFREMGPFFHSTGTALSLYTSRARETNPLSSAKASFAALTGKPESRNWSV
jgi:hypothetical protein